MGYTVLYLARLKNKCRLCLKFLSNTGSFIELSQGTRTATEGSIMGKPVALEG